MSFVDQMVFRFARLQDTMGEKIFPAILWPGGEETRQKTFIDPLNRLEELGVVDRNTWLRLREVRNNIAREYAYSQEETVKNLTAVYEKAAELTRIHQHAQNYCDKKYNLRQTR